MSDKTSGMTDERAVLMLELLGTIVQRFDGVEDAMAALSKLHKQTAAKKPVERNVEINGAALRKAVMDGVASGASASIDPRIDALSEILSSRVEYALLGDRQDARRLGEAAENMLDMIRRWAPFALGGTFLVGLLLGALLAP